MNLGFALYSTQHLIHEAANMIRYNPVLAIKWFAEARQRLAGTFLVTLYNRRAEEANAYLDSVEKMRYYKRDTFWEATGKKPERIPLVPELVDMLEEVEKLAAQGKI